MIAGLFRGGVIIVLEFGLVEVDDEIRPGAVCLGACTPFAAGNGEEAHLLYESDYSVDGGGGGDELVTVGGKLPSLLDFLEQGIDGGGGRPGCTHARNVGGKMVMVHQYVGCPEVLKKFTGFHGGIPNIFVI